MIAGSAAPIVKKVRRYVFVFANNNELKRACFCEEGRRATEINSASALELSPYSCHQSLVFSQVTYFTLISRFWASE